VIGHGDAAQATNIRAKSDGRFGKQDFAYLADEDVYRCRLRRANVGSLELIQRSAPALQEKSCRLEKRRQQ
jgi:hypothetical protein